MEKILKSIGLLLLIALFALCVPFMIPKLMGYEMLEIKSESMKPEIPSGSLIFVDKVDAAEIFEDDVISFYEEGNDKNIVTHRVIEIDEENKAFVTKGDANSKQDEKTVSYDKLIGKEVFCIKNGASLSKFINSIWGKIVAAVMLFLIIVCWVYSNILIERKYKKQLSEYENEDISDDSDDSKKKPKRGRGFGSDALVIIGLALVVFSGYNLFMIFSDYKASDDLYEEIQEECVVEAEEIKPETPWYEQLTVDFTELKNKNKDVVGWIYFENENISYPIMYSGDDTYYLRRTFDGSSATAGSIFLEGENNPDFNDYHSIIYGHNMKNLSMFGKLKYYNRDDEYYKDHQYFQVFVDGAVYRYQIFSYETIDESSSEYTVGFSADDKFGEFVAQMAADSMKDTGIVPTKDDKIVTLSTCSTSGDAYRFVVHGVKIDEHKY